VLPYMEMTLVNAYNELKGAEVINVVATDPEEPAENSN